MHKVNLVLIVPYKHPTTTIARGTLNKASDYRANRLLTLTLTPTLTLVH